MAKQITYGEDGRRALEKGENALADTVNITLFRAGAEVEVTVVLDEKPSQDELEAAVQQEQQQQQEEYYYQYPFGFGN